MTDEPERGGKPTGEPEGLPERSTQPLPGATGITTSSDIQEDARGTGHFPTGEMSLLERMILLTRSQNPPVEFQWNQTTAIANDDWLYMLSDLASDAEANAGETYYTPDALNVVVGTPQGASALSDMQTPVDGNIYNLQEVAAAPAIDMRLTYNNVTSFNRFMVLAYYDGATTHTVALELYNNNTTNWDRYDSLAHDSSNPTMQQFYCAVPSDTNYISSGTVLLRFYHPQNGQTSHDLYVDYAALVEVG